MAFKDKLRELLYLNNMKAIDLSRASGIGAPTISHYLNGKKQPTAKNSIAIAKAFHISIDELLEYNYNNESNFDIPILSTGGNSHNISFTERNSLINELNSQDDEIMHLRGQIIAIIQKAPIDKCSGEVLIKMLNGLFDK